MGQAHLDYAKEAAHENANTHRIGNAARSRSGQLSANVSEPPRKG